MSIFTLWKRNPIPTEPTKQLDSNRDWPKYKYEVETVAECNYLPAREFIGSHYKLGYSKVKLYGLWLPDVELGRYIKAKEQDGWEFVSKETERYIPPPGHAGSHSIHRCLFRRLNEGEED